MSLNDFLLEILVCPSTKQPVAFASSEFVLEVNQKIVDGMVRDLGGELVSEEVDALLLRSDGEVAYPVRGAIPEMLAERGIASKF